MSTAHATTTQYVITRCRQQHSRVQCILAPLPKTDLIAATSLAELSLTGLRIGPESPGCAVAATLPGIAALLEARLGDAFRLGDRSRVSPRMEGSSAMERLRFSVGDELAACRQRGRHDEER